MCNTVTYYILLYAVVITYTMYQLISKLYVINIKFYFPNTVLIISVA